jgi:DNA-binding CsgD family transcriptional regulator
MTTLKDELLLLGAELECALEDSHAPLYLLDREGRFRWANRSSTDLLGCVVGRKYPLVVAPEQSHMARQQFARKVIGEAAATEFDVTLIGSGCRLDVRIQSVPLRCGDTVVAVFGAALPRGGDGPTEAVGRSSADGLTARQLEVLKLLGGGLGTAAIAERLGVSEDTVRNHIRPLLRQLGVHSRLEAVVEAYRLGVLGGSEH